MRSSLPLIMAAFALNCLIWGSTWMVIKIGLRGAPPMTGVGMRFAVAAVLISTVVAIGRLPVPRTRRFMAISLFLGVFHLALPYVLVYWGEQHISSGLTAVLYSTLPFMVALLARLLLGDPLTATKLVGICAGIAGVWFIFSDAVHVTSGSEVAGMVAVLCSVFFAALASVFIKKYSSGYHPIVSLMIPFVVGAALVSAFAVPIERSNPLHYDRATWGTIIYLAVAGSFVAFAVFFWLMKRIDVTVVSYQTFIIPIIAVFFGWVFLDETISAKVAVGTAFILSGIVIATVGNRKKKAEGT